MLFILFADQSESTLDSFNYYEFLEEKTGDKFD